MRGHRGFLFHGASWGVQQQEGRLICLYFSAEEPLQFHPDIFDVQDLDSVRHAQSQLHIFCEASFSMEKE